MSRRGTVLALLGATVLALASAPRASAGEYPVYACEPAVGDVNHSWVAESTDPQMAAYVNCPVPWNETRTWNRGLVTLHRVSGSTSGQRVAGFENAALRFSAPRGASLSRMTFEHAFCGRSSFDAGLLNAASQWLVVSAPDSCGVLLPSPFTLSLGGTPTVRLITICARSRCADERAYATMRSATVWVSDATPPSVRIAGGSLVARGWHRGTQSVVVNASDNVGVRHFDVYLDDKQAAGRDGNCDWTYTVPCVIGAGAVGVESAIVPDGRHTLRVNALDSAGNVSSTTAAVLIDNTPPSGPVDLRLAGSEVWRPTNDFAVSWTNPPQRGTAPIVGARWTVCPAANQPTDTTGCASGSRTSSGVHAVGRLQVPAPGDWIARFWLVDGAGNAQPQSARSVHLRYDPNVPDIAILPAIASDPQRVTINASDALAGLVRVEVEIRREGDDAWVSLPVSSAAPGQFVAYVNDAVLPKGHYLLRARALDAAGNERSTNTRGGKAAVLDLPLRLSPSFSLGMARRVKRHGRRRTVLRRHPLVPFGKPVRLRGRLTLPGGNGLAAADLQVFARVTLGGARWRRVGLVRTGKKGRFQYKAARGPSRRLRFAYAGTPLIRPRTVEMRIRVRAKTSFHVNRRHVVNGDEVRFHGRVHGRLPRTGKLLQLQAYSRGTWRTFATPRASRRTHRWHYRYRFSATRGLVRYRFRAVLPTETGFPYARGRSRSIHITVRGL